jgi:hypothetical protein
VARQRRPAIACAPLTVRQVTTSHKPATRARRNQHMTPVDLVPATNVVYSEPQAFQPCYYKDDQVSWVGARTVCLQEASYVQRTYTSQSDDVYRYEPVHCSLGISLAAMSQLRKTKTQHLKKSCFDDGHN